MSFPSLRFALSRAVVLGLGDQLRRALATYTKSGGQGNLRQSCWDHWRPLYVKDRWWDEPQTGELNQDLRTVQSIGHPSEVILRGICCPPDGVLPDAPPLKPCEVYLATESFGRVVPVPEPGAGPESNPVKPGQDESSQAPA